MHDVVVVVIHQDGNGLTNDEGHPHGHVAHFAVQIAIHKHCKWYLQTQRMFTQANK